MQYALSIKEDGLVFVSGNKQETGERKAAVTRREKRAQKMGKKNKRQRNWREERVSEQAVTYLCESEHMNMEELNSSE